MLLKWAMRRAKNNAEKITFVSAMLELILLILKLPLTDEMHWE